MLVPSQRNSEDFSKVNHCGDSCILVCAGLRHPLFHRKFLSEFTRFVKNGLLLGKQLVEGKVYIQGPKHFLKKVMTVRNFSRPAKH
jgi:hypothetical protein